MQVAAERHMAGLRPHFASRYAKFGGKGRHRAGEVVRIAVLDDHDFGVAVQVFRDELRDEGLALAPKYIPRYVSDRISGVGSGPPGAVVRITVTPTMTLTATQRALVAPPIQRTTIAAGAFYSIKRDTIFMRMSQVGVGAIAHEMCHAYASSTWDEFYVAMSLQTALVDGRGRGKEPLGDVFFDIDEGLTIMLANLVIDDAFPRTGRYSSSRGAHDAQAGYSPDRLTTAQNVVRAVDGGLGTDPGSNIALAYFGGALTFTIDEERPLASSVRLGRARSRRLGDLL
ncbi:MAG: hypothetical protein ABL886_02195 [Rhodoglobus sp.]